ARCPSGRYMDCWFNALTAAVSRDGGETFHRLPGVALIAALPYRYGETGLGHHGYFNPSNIITRANAAHMFVFATRAGVQRAGNCLLRTETIGEPGSWRGWDGIAFRIVFVNPYEARARPEDHVCTPLAPGILRWPVTSIARHVPSGLFVA